jgi:hypothetical protein
MADPAVESKRMPSGMARCIGFKVIAVQIGYHLCKTGLISLGSWICMGVFQIQVHRGDTPACRRAGRTLRGDGISGESVRGPEPRGVQGLAPILQKLHACGHNHVRKDQDF